MQNALLGTRVLITQATEFMGPALCEVFAAQGAEVVASTPPLAAPDIAEDVAQHAGRIDVLVVNLASRAADCFVGQVFPVCGGWVPR